MRETPLLLTTKPVRKNGNSYVVSLSKEVRAVMKIKLGDQITFRKVGRYVFIAVVRAFEVIPISTDELRQARAERGA